MLCQRIPWTSWDPPLVSPQMQAAQAVRRILWTSRDPPLGSHQTQAPMLSGGSLGHPGILPWCPLRHRPPSCSEDPLDILGSSLAVLSDKGPVLSRGFFRHPGIFPSCLFRHSPQAVQRIPWTSWDPSFMSPQTQVPMLSGGFQDPMPANHSSSKLLRLSTACCIIS